MTLRPEYSLGHSAYNGFLHAEVGEEANGVRLTVLTALTRLGIDPWQEAARLADLPRDVAITALAAAIARLPEGNWKAADAEAIATRLAGLLPGHSSAAIAQPQPRAPDSGSGAAPAAPGSRPKATLSTWLLWGVAALVLYFLFLQFQPDNNLEPPSGPASTTQR
jgi:hypothetical protein